MAWPPARAGGARQIATRGHRMTKPELGTKRVCVACNTRFYDLGKTPAVCPKCGTEQPIEQPRPRRPGGNVSDQKPIKKPAAVVGADEADLPEVGCRGRGRRGCPGRHRGSRGQRRY